MEPMCLYRLPVKSALKRVIKDRLGLGPQSEREQGTMLATNTHILEALRQMDRGPCFCRREKAETEAGQGRNPGAG